MEFIYRAMSGANFMVALICLFAIQDSAVPIIPAMAGTCTMAIAFVLWQD